MKKNTSNRKKKSQEKIEKIFINLLQKYELNEITVSDICKLAGINRSTFYANYLDIYDLADKLQDTMFNNLLELYKDEAIAREHSYNYLKLFEHIKNNQIYYKTLFKLNFDFSKYIDYDLVRLEAKKYFDDIKFVDYHVEYFKAGLSAIIKKWLYNGCVESPEEISNILETEYKKRNTTI